MHVSFVIDSNHSPPTDRRDGAPAKATICLCQNPKRHSTKRMTKSEIESFDSLAAFA
jgi:hypothetical protein